jgi:hypothetical protein
MIAARVQCDADGCERHFAAPGPELAPRPGPRLTRPEPRHTLVLTAPYLVLPAGWAACEDGRVLCSDHVPDWRDARISRREGREA